MKKRLFALPLLAALLLTACGSAPEISAPESSDEAKDPSASVEECIEFLEKSAKQTFSDDFEVVRDGETVELVAWNEAVTKELPSALAKKQSYVDAWNEMTEAFTELSANIQDMFQRHGHDEIIARVNIVESSENRATIFAAQNGKLVYDVVNHIDTLGVNKARAEAIAANFDGLIDGATVSATGTYKSVEVHLATDFSAEAKPEGWEQIQQTVIDRIDGINIVEGTTLYVMLEAAGGDILSTLTNGSISYDVYEKAEESAAAAAQNVASASSGRIVYVSKSSHTIHSVSDCSGMKRYNSMTQSEADANGYKYCPNCW